MLSGVVVVVIEVGGFYVIGEGMVRGVYGCEFCIWKFWHAVQG
jgi:hypothetical protein